MKRLPVLLLLLGAASGAEVDALLDSKDPRKRLEGVAALASRGGAGAEDALVELLDDKDWEVVHEAAAALAARGTKKSVPVLVGLAVDGPVRRIRAVAAQSAAALDAAEAWALLLKKMRGDDVPRALEALEEVAYADGETKSLERLLKNKEGDVRALALRAYGSQKKAERIPEYAEFLKDLDVRVTAAAAAALVATGSLDAVPVLRDDLKRRGLTDVQARRDIHGLVELLRANAKHDKLDFQLKLLVRTFGMSGTPRADARFARLLGRLGDKAAPVGAPGRYVEALLGTGLGNSDEAVRSAAAKALARIGDGAAVEKVVSKAKSDGSARVRFHALRAVVSLQGDDAWETVLAALKGDAAPEVREEAAAIAGKRRWTKAVGALIAALTDENAAVRQVAAVSLGKTRDERGVAPLVALFQEEKKVWELRGAALTGLGWIQQKAAVPVLIDGLRDREAAVAATAREFLRHLAGQDHGAKPKGWREWWAKHEPTYGFRNRDAEAKQAKKYGYAVSPRRVYDDLDVLVLDTRRGGDRIQDLLTLYEIEHRIVRAASVHKVGLHPYTLFVANCPGEITDKDVERLRWFVRCGGYLFASCWSLTHTIDLAFPGVVRKLPLKGQVIGVVGAEPRPSTSPFLQGVFDKYTHALYTLEGAHLIEVLDPERFEVLVDSPDAATQWGEGNLAGWFSVGHGVVLDSANHFDLQGLAKAKTKTEADRAAFVMDHLGYGYEELRALRDKGVFRKQSDAMKATRDLNIFRFITTFVREKRKADEQ